MGKSEDEKKNLSRSFLCHAHLHPASSLLIPFSIFQPELPLTNTQFPLLPNKPLPSNSKTYLTLPPTPPNNPSPTPAPRSHDLQPLDRAPAILIQPAQIIHTRFLQIESTCETSSLACNLLSSTTTSCSAGKAVLAETSGISIPVIRSPPYAPRGRTVDAQRR